MHLIFQLLNPIPKEFCVLDFFEDSISASNAIDLAVFLFYFNHIFLHIGL